MCSTSLYSGPGLCQRKCNCATQQEGTDDVSSQQLRTSCRPIYSCNTTETNTIVQHRHCCCVLPPACSFQSAHSGSCHHVVEMLIISVCLRNKLDTADWSVMCHIYLLMVEFLCLLSYQMCTINDELANMLTHKPTNLNLFRLITCLTCRMMCHGVMLLGAK